MLRAARSRALRLPAPADAAVVVPAPVAAVAGVSAAVNADAGVCTHAADMRADTHAIAANTGTHADRSHLHAGGSALRQRGARGDEARGKKEGGPKLHV